LTEWTPNYDQIWADRLKRAHWLETHPDEIPALEAYYRHHPIEFIEDWCVTIDPRNVGKGKPVTMPFVLFPRQKEAIQFLYDHVLVKKRHCLFDKCRDSGATWFCCAFSVWLWLFHEGSAIGWGSRKQQLVDLAGDMSSIFEKMRGIIRNIPDPLMPKGFNKKRDLRGLMKILNPDNGASIVGECGDNIGRGGRTTCYFKDESAHYPRPQPIESALGNNTDVQIDISTHLGTDTVFFNKTQKWPRDRIFEFSWDQNPLHTQEWYDKQEADYNDMGMPHLMQQEVLRNPAGSKINVVIPNAWVLAAVDAHLYMHLPVEGKKCLGLDVADEGKDENALCQRHGILVQDVESWHHGTTTETCEHAFLKCDEKRVYELVYDNIGVGAGVKGAAKDKNKARKKKITAIGWCAGGEVIDKKHEFVEGKTNADMFKNAKAQAWWELRERFRKVWEAVNLDKIYDASEMISISSAIEDQQTLCNQLSQATYQFDGAGKIVIDKLGEGVRSPNMADAVVIAFARHSLKSLHKQKVAGLY
jgi:hypothetical protein